MALIVSPSRRDVLRLGSALLGAPALSCYAAADAVWPSRMIRIVCGFAAGGLVDLFARAYGEHIAARTGQPVIVENKTGASGSLAAREVAHAPADGYTLMMTSVVTISMNKVLFKELPYDPDRDFAPIAWLSTGHLPLIVHRRVPATNIDEFVRYARDNDCSLGSYGAGSYSHMVVEALNRHFGLKIATVHYRGEAAMWQDVLSGVLHGGTGTYAGANGVLQSGIGRAIAVPTKVRMKRLPDVATFYEQGLADPVFQLRGWIGLFGRAGTPDEVVQRLSDLMVEGGKTARVQSLLESFGIDDAARDRAYFLQMIAEEDPVWMNELRRLNLQAQ